MWLRCPEWNHKFAELSDNTEIDMKVFIETPYIEFACSRCKRYMQDNQDSSVTQVWHKFDLNGDLLETSVGRTDTGDRSIPSPNFRS